MTNSDEIPYLTDLDMPPFLETVATEGIETTHDPVAFANGFKRGYDVAVMESYDNWKQDKATSLGY